MRRPGVRAEVQRIEREAAELLRRVAESPTRGRSYSGAGGEANGNTGAGDCAPRARAGNREALSVRRHATKVREGVRVAAGLTRGMTESHPASQKTRESDLWSSRSV